MRRVLVLGLLPLVGLAACQKKPESTAAATGEAAMASANAPAAPVAPAGPPKRKPGLWAQTVSTAGRTQTSKICLDEATDARMSAWGQAMGQDICSKNAVTPIAGGWKFDAECSMGGGKTSTTGTATGDFNSKYVVKATTVTSGSSMPQADGTHDMELTATWEGPCPAGMKPGDMSMSMPGTGRTMTININEMAAKK